MPAQSVCGVCLGTADYVFATGQSYSVRQFLEESFGYAGLDWQKHVEIDPKYFRPAEVDFLMGDPGKANEQLGWKAKTSFKDLVKMMVDADEELAKQEKTLTDAGHAVNLTGMHGG